MKKPKVLKLTSQEADDLLKRIAECPVSKEDYEIIKGMVQTILVLSRALEEKVTSIKRLLKMLFGIKTETAKNISKELEKTQSESSAENAQETEENQDIQAKKEKPKGHGKNGSSSYTGAVKKKISHITLKSGDSCPSCKDGRVYCLSEPGTIVRVTGAPPIQATVYELEKFRCNLCLEVFTAQPPPEVGQEKYDEAAGAMIAILRYGGGFPFYRLQELQKSAGIPLPDATQWEVVERVADRIHRAYLELVRQAAQGEIIHNDDTTIKILGVMKEKDTEGKNGMFTTGIISILRDGRKIALFFTGKNHAGDNMKTLLSQRQKELPLPIQMCDALSSNTAQELDVILANCLLHARRNFVDVADNFPEECRFVIETFKEIYKNEETCRVNGFSKEKRLEFHKGNSGFAMENLQKWCRRQFDDRLVEPNSGLGAAIKYMLGHWEELTLFLRVAGAPLDNNICERALKQAILHRKNSLFYKNGHGAYIGDLFMSLIQTCKLSGVNAFEYLKALQKHSSDVFKNPKDWLPWNYHEATLSEKVV